MFDGVSHEDNQLVQFMQCPLSAVEPFGVEPRSIDIDMWLFRSGANGYVIPVHNIIATKRARAIVRYTEAVQVCLKVVEVSQLNRVCTVRDYRQEQYPQLSCVCFVWSLTVASMREFRHSCAADTSLSPSKASSSDSSSPAMPIWLGIQLTDGFARVKK